VRRERRTQDTTHVVGPAHRSPWPNGRIHGPNRVTRAPVPASAPVTNGSPIASAVEPTHARPMLGGRLRTPRRPVAPFQHPITAGPPRSLPPTPYYLVDEARLAANLEVVDRVRSRSGARALLALKCFVSWGVFPLLRAHLDGTT
jgi:hypothetical protein